MSSSDRYWGRNEPGPTVDLTDAPPDVTEGADVRLPSLHVKTQRERDLSGFAAALRKEIQRRGLTGKQFAASLSRPHSSVSNWLNGVSAPEPLDVFRLEETLGVAPGNLSKHLGYLPLNAGKKTPGFLEALEAAGLDPESESAIRWAYETALRNRARNRTT